MTSSVSESTLGRTPPSQSSLLGLAAGKGSNEPTEGTGETFIHSFIQLLPYHLRFILFPALFSCFWFFVLERERAREWVRRTEGVKES